MEEIQSEINANENEENSDLINNLEENEQEIENTEPELENLTEVEENPNNDNEENLDEEKGENVLEEQQNEEEFSENKDLDKEDNNDQINDDVNNIEKNIETEDVIDNVEETNVDQENVNFIEESEESPDIINSFIGDIIDILIDNVMRSKGDLEGDDNEGIIREKSGDEGFPEYHMFGAIEEAVEPEDQMEEDEDRRSGQQLENIEYETEDTERVEDDGQHDGAEEEMNEENEEEQQEEQEQEVKLSKEELIQELRNANSEEESLKKLNTSLQHKIGDYMRKRRVEQTSAAIAEEKGIIDFEQKYMKQMDNLRELIYEYEYENDQYKIKIDDLQNETTNREERVKKEKEKFQNHRYIISQKSVNTRTGKSIAPKDLEAIILNEEKKEALVVETRLISIKLQNEVNKIESILKSKEELADGLHLIDFEQFKIENQSYNEKLEERTEDLLKLRKKITSNVHILTHVKEKLEFVKYECDLEQKILKEIDEKLSSSRDQLTSFKQSRDKLRTSNQKFKKSCGMLGNSDLLRNYEDCVDTVEIQMEKMNEMKNKQIKLTLRNQALQMKIDNARLESSHG